MSTSIGPIYMKAPIEIAKTWKLTSILNTNPPPASPVTSSSSSTSSDSTATVSSPGSLLTNLENLKSTQPETFQAALTKAASGLSTAAQQSGSSTSQGQLLSKAAAVLQNVASTGDVSKLQPTPAANVVEKTYAPNQASSSQSILSLLSSVSQASSKSAGSTKSVPLVSADAGSSAQKDAVSNILQDLQKVLQA